MSDYFLIGDEVVLETSVPVIDQNEGLFWRDVFVGPQQSLLSRQQALNLSPDVRVSITQRNGPIYQMEVLTPDYTDGQFSALNKFALITHEVDKALADHPKALALDSADLDLIRQLVRDKTKIDDITFGSADAAIIYSKYLLGNGSAKFLDFERTFRWSVVCSARYGTLIAETNKKTRWSAADILNPNRSGLIFPPSVRFNLAAVDAAAPTAIVKTIPAPGVGGGTTTETYSWSWLKVGSEYEPLPSGKCRLTSEWKGDMWSEWEYPAASF